MKKVVSILLSAAFIVGAVFISVRMIMGSNRNDLPVNATFPVSSTVSSESTESSTGQETVPAETTAAHIISANYDHDAYLQQIMDIAKKYGAIGVSVALVENGRVIDTFACGTAVQDSMAMTENTKIRIASISKVFVGIATMISVENGTMSLDEDIGTYWGFKMGTHTAGDVITPRALLTHTSSVMATEESSAMFYDGMAERLRSGSGIGNHVSGNIGYYYYNNYAIDVLGMTVELANNRTLDSILSDRIFSKLGIDAAFFCGDMKDTSEVADHYYAGGELALSADKMRTWHSRGAGRSGWTFAGGMTINASDLGKVVAMLSNRGVYNGVRCLSEESVRNLEYHEGNKVDHFWQCQPLRYETNKYGQQEFYYHTGSAYGVLSMAGYNPDTGAGIAVLTTGASRGHKGADIFDAIADLLLNRGS